MKPTDALVSNFIGNYDFTRLGQSFCPSSGVLSRTPALVQFMQFGDRVLPGAGWNWNCRCTAKNSWWWAERLPETCKVIITNKIGTQCVCWFYSQGIYHYARSYNFKIKTKVLCEKNNGVYCSMVHVPSKCPLNMLNSSLILMFSISGTNKPHRPTTLRSL